MRTACCHIEYAWHFYNALHIRYGAVLYYHVLRWRYNVPYRTCTVPSYEYSICYGSYILKYTELSTKRGGSDTEQNRDNTRRKHCRQLPQMWPVLHPDAAHSRDYHRATDGS